MVSIIITTYKELQTLPKAIKSILSQKFKQEYELLIIGPDKKTQEIVQKFAQDSRVKYLKDDGKGKPVALNLAFKKAQGEIFILTDGDVWVAKNSLNRLIEQFQNGQIGAVTGQPISINSKKNIFGYWSHFLTNAAHQWRLRGKDFPCSGYLYAFRNIIKEIPKNALAEDGIITQMIRNENYTVAYAPEAKVYVKYPDNFKDWLKQKTRSTGGYWQKFQTSVTETKKTRGFRQEIFDGIKLFFTYPKTLKEFIWTFFLYLARIFLWLNIFWKIKIKKKSFNSIWQRIESTK